MRHRPVITKKAGMPIKNGNVSSYLHSNLGRCPHPLSSVDGKDVS